MVDQFMVGIMLQLNNKIKKKNKNKIPERRSMCGKRNCCSY